MRGATVTYTIRIPFRRGPVSSGRRVSPTSSPRHVLRARQFSAWTAHALTDAVDADTGDFDGSTIHVALGDVPAPVTRTIEFKVTIQ